MKLHVVYNKDGDILGAVRLDMDAKVRVLPMADEQQGHRAADVDVPTEYHQYNMADICQKLTVDARGKLPELKVK